MTANKNAMTIEMVSILTQIRKQPGISKEQIAKNLKLSIDDVTLSLAGLKLRGLISLNAKQQCEPVGEPV